MAAVAREAEAAPGVTAGKAAALVLSVKGASIRIDPASFEISATNAAGRSRLISLGLGYTSDQDAVVKRISSTEAIIIHPSRGLSLRARVSNGDITLDMTMESPGSVSWPAIPIAEADGLIWPLADGRYVSTADGAWMRDIAEEGDHELGHGLPLWGWTNAGGTVAWATETPYRNAIAVEKGVLAMKQTFLCRRGVETHAIALRVSDEAEPLLPAFLLRDRLLASGQFKTLTEKLAGLPPGSRERLLGSIQAYLWGKKSISTRDVKPAAYGKLAERLSDGSAFGSRVLGLMDKESKDAVAAFVEDEWAGAYAKGELVRGLDAALSAISAKELYAKYADCFSPPQTWGEGISPALVRELTALGIDRARLTLPESGFDYAATAKAAAEAGFLFGIYDSYHSIHPKSIWDTDASWETARFTEGLYASGSIMKADGGFYSGYKGKGRLLSPIAAWPYFKARVEKNLALAPLSFYFMDCDAAGEIREDYSPLHPATSEEAATARRERLDWLRSEKSLLVGSEGGDALIDPSILVSEGLFGPVFSWEEDEYRDKASPFFAGAYWPEGAPAIQFKAMKLKPDSVRRYFDPKTRLPLFEAAFHDSLVITSHWSADALKFAGLECESELFQMLYLAAPMYNLNRDRLADRGPAITANYAFYSPLHRRYGDARLIGFDWLTPDRLVQRTKFEGGLDIVANFSDAAYVYGARTVPARSVLAILPEGAAMVFAPK